MLMESLERAAGIEPALKAWKALVIPFHHARGDITRSRAAAPGQGMSVTSIDAHRFFVVAKVRPRHGMCAAETTGRRGCSAQLIPVTVSR